MKFLEILINSIVENKSMPKVQVEREISPFLDIFIESFMNELSKNMIIDKGYYNFIAPEFPLTNDLDNKQSINIDYLMLNNKTLYKYRLFDVK